MILLPGRITVQQLQRGEAYASNAGAVVVGLATTTLVTLADLVVVAGDRVFVTCSVWGTKNAIPGVVTAQITDVGPDADVDFNANSPSTFWTAGFVGDDAAGWPIAGVGVVAAGGTMQLRLSAITSAGSWTVGINAAQLYAWVVATG